jgi:hypothetical protein
VDAKEPSTWHYEARMESQDGKFMGRVEAEPMGARVTAPGRPASPQSIPVIAPFQRLFLMHVFMHLWGISAHEARLIQSDMIGDAIAAIRGRFDEALGGFDALTGRGRSGADLTDAAALITQMHADKGSGPGSGNFYIPLYVIGAALMKAAVGADSITLGSFGLPFLSKTVRFCDFQTADMLLKLESKTVEKHWSTLRYGTFAFTFTLRDGSAINHDALSYGQKRLLSFLYHLDVNKDIIIADELVNGLHYDWIEACIEEMGDRQAFLTSQNPLLLDFLHFESAEEARRSFILCRREQRDDKTATFWENLDEATAEAFFRAYQTRALQVSEILRTKGLW